MRYFSGKVPLDTKLGEQKCQWVLRSSLIFFFALPAFAQLPTKHSLAHFKKLVDADALVKEKSLLLQSADRLNFTDYKVCYEIGSLAERAYALVAASQENENQTRSQNTELTLNGSLRIKLTKQISELESFCNHNLENADFNEGDRPELFKRLTEIDDLRLDLLKNSIKN